MIKSPDWCTNHVRIGGDRETIAKVKEFVRHDNRINENAVFSLKSIEPMPPEIRETISPNRDEKLAAQLTEKYGYPCWYSWSTSHWGTKWDTRDSALTFETETFLEYYFHTAWSPPEPAIRKLSELFPTLDIEIEYDEPGGNFWGISDYLGGELQAREEGPSISMAAFEDDIIEQEEDLPDEDF